MLSPQPGPPHLPRGTLANIRGNMLPALGFLADPEGPHAARGSDGVGKKVGRVRPPRPPPWLSCPASPISE